MQEERGEGVVLASYPYLSGRRILKIFTREHGLISLIISRRHSPLLSSSLSTAEFVYLKKTSELYKLIDLKILHHQFELRKNYNHIDAAAHIAKLLLESQLPGKKANLLYDLLQAYFRKIPSANDPNILVASFALKVLNHDGLIHLSSVCAKCKKPASIFYLGESLCRSDAEEGGFLFTEEEWQTLLSLTYSQTFSDLEMITLSSSLSLRILQIFHSF